MNYKQKLAYMALGGILVFMGLLVSHTLSRDVTAEEEGLKINRRRQLFVNRRMLGPPEAKSEL